MLTPEVQARIEREKERAKQRNEGLTSDFGKPKSCELILLALSPPQTTLPPYCALALFEGQRQQFRTAFTGIASLDVAPLIWRCSMGRLGFICEMC